MAVRTSAVITIIWFFLPLHCNYDSGQMVHLSFCWYLCLPSTGLWQHRCYQNNPIVFVNVMAFLVLEMFVGLEVDGMA